MKILFVAHSTEMSGSSKSLITLVEGLIEKGCEVVIVCPLNVNESYRRKVEDLNVTLIPIKICMDVLGKSFKEKLRHYLKKVLLFKAVRRFLTKRSLREIIKKENPDIVHTNVGVVHVAQEVCCELGVRHVWHLREYQIKDFNWRILPSKEKFESKLRKSDAIISITKDINTYFGLDNYKNAEVIYNGVLSEKDVVIHYPKHKYFLCASRISSEKGLEDVLIAFSRFYNNHPDYKLKIAGFGDFAYVQKLKKKAEDLNCIDGIDFLGYVENIVSLMKDAVALIVASYYEGFGRMTAEAIFCGCPVIGRNTGGTKEILDMIDSYAFVDNDGLLNCMEVVLAEDRDVFFRKMNKSQIEIKKMCSKEVYVNRVFDVYKKILCC